MVTGLSMRNVQLRLWSKHTKNFTWNEQRNRYHNKNTNGKHRKYTLQVKEVVKQGTIFGPIMWCAETSTVNSTGEEVNYRYGRINIGMPVFMDDIATAGKTEHVRKGINNYARMEKEKKINFGLKTTKYD